MGAGVPVIANAINGKVRPEAFLLKIVFTALTLEAGFRGGEIVPSFFVGATFGCLFGQFVTPQNTATIPIAAQSDGEIPQICPKRQPKVAPT